MALEPGFFSPGSSGAAPLQAVGATPMRYRVLRVDGTELTPDLPHLTGGTCETNGVVRGLWPPSATIGKLNLPLIPPKAQHLAEGMWPGIDVAALYAQLGYGQRIERYDRVTGGNPNWTGVIHQTPKDFRKFALAALDSWELHQKAEVERKTYFRDTATNIIRDAIKDWTLLYGDDMAPGDMKITDGPGHGVVYSPIATNGGYYNVWSSVTLEDGKNWVTAQPGNTGSILHNRGSYTSAQLLPSKIDALIRVRPYGTSSTGVSGGIIFGLDLAAGTFFQSEFGVDSTAGVGQPAIGHLKLFHYSNWGVATQLYDLPFELGQILPGTPFELNFQMQVLPQPNSGSGSGGIRVLLNGLDVQGSTILMDMSALTGAIGFYAYGAGQVWARNLFAFDRIPQMTLASGFPETSPVIELTFNQTSGLDQLMIAANAADISIRKNCKPDMDEIEGVVGDFPPITTPPPIFKEELDPSLPGNVISGQEQDNASKFATQLKVQGQSLGTTPAVYAVRDLSALRKYGLWTKQENLEDVSNFKVLVAAGDGASVLSAAPASAGSLNVEDGSSTKGLWRELSTIRVQTIHLDILLADSLREVVGYTETDGSPQKKLLLDQFPMTMALPDIKKMQDSIDNLIGAALIYQVPPPGQPGIQPTNPAGPNLTWNSVTSVSGPAHTWSVPNPLNPSGPQIPIGGSGGGVNMVTTGSFSLPSPATITPSASLILSSVPFTVLDHPCWILTFAMLETLSTGGVGEFFKVELRVGPDTATPDLVSNDVTMMIDPGNLQKATLIAPNSSPLPVGSYVAYVVATSQGTVDMTITSVAGQFQVYCA